MTAGTRQNIWWRLGAILCAAMLALAALQGCSPRRHTVLLKWNASTSKDVVGYNVYRRALPNGSYTKINADLVKGTTFVDRYVESGRKYSYVVKAVAHGEESVDSNTADADVR
jgi:hypothetical protein